MKALQLFWGLILFFSCSPRLQDFKSSPSVIDLFNKASVKSIASPGNKTIDTHIYERRVAAAKLFNIVTDTSKLSTFIVIDMGNLEGADYFGEIVINDTHKYFYTSSYLMPDKKVNIKKYDYSPLSSKTEEFILEHLKAHRFVELQAFAKEKGKNISV